MTSTPEPAEAPEQPTVQGVAGEAPPAALEVEEVTEQTAGPPHGASSPASEVEEATEQTAEHPHGASKPSLSFGDANDGAELYMLSPREETVQKRPSLRSVPSRAQVSGEQTSAVERINAQLGEIPAIGALSETLKIRPLGVAAGAVLAFLSFILYGIGGQLICTMAGSLYPAFECFRVLESGDQERMVFWMNYWVVYGLITAVEHLLFYIMIWIPFYFPLKLGLILWLFSNRTNGATYMYAWAVSPFLSRNQLTIERTLDSSATCLRHSVSGAVGIGLSATAGAGVDGIARVRRGIITYAPVATMKTYGAMSNLMTEAAALRRRGSWRESKEVD